MALNVPEDVALAIVAALEDAGSTDEDRLDDALYDLADTIRGTISNTPNGTDAAVTFTA